MRKRKQIKSDAMFVTPSFSRGVASILGAWRDRHESNYHHYSPQQADDLAIASDFYMIGGDLANILSARESITQKNK